MLRIDSAILSVIDIQGKLASLMAEREQLFENTRRMIEGATLFDIPILLSEQLPDKLGPTVSELAPHLSNVLPIVKSSFSCCGADVYRATLVETGRRQVILTGIEAHICVYQTAADLLADGYEVHVVADAVSSRVARSRDIALDRLARMGASITCTEMALFELQRVAEGDTFRSLLRIVR
ncbi:MAG: nicotinamidase-related amidase [Rhodothermales bacterium]|jgi:nicotinamidase-related amidase